MATIYSLICWGGSTGKTVTMTIASPCVVTITNHGLHDGTGIVFSTTGVLPTGITAGVTYYSKSTAANTFNLYTDTALTNIVNTSGSQSGTHTAKSSYFHELSDTSRWGTRIYDSMYSWGTARLSSASPFDTEVCEVGMGWVDSLGGIVDLSSCLAPCVIHSKVSNVYTSAFHYGNINSGYIAKRAGGCIKLSKYSHVVDGLTFYSSSSGETIYVAGQSSTLRNCISLGPNSGQTTSSRGIRVVGAMHILDNCMSLGHYYGMYIDQYAVVAVNNCLIAKNSTYGVYVQYTTGYFRQFVNNISLKSGTNWTTRPSTIELCSNNAGESGDATWDSVGSTAITVSTSDFVSFGSNTAWASSDDLRIASSSSALYDGGTDYPNAVQIDISGNERISYNNGGSETIDVGPYEYDNGYGPHPASHTLTLTNVVVGSRVHIEDANKTTVHYDQIAASSTVEVTITVYGGSKDNWVIKIRKASASPTYRPYRTQMTATAGASSIYVEQQLDE